MSIWPRQFTSMVTQPYGIHTTECWTSLTARKADFENWLKGAGGRFMSHSSVPFMVAPRSKDAA